MSDHSTTRRQLLQYLTVISGIGAGVGEVSTQLECDPDTLHESYETTSVTIRDGETRDEKGTLTTAIAETDETQARGLSATECLPTDRGMLFVFESQAEQVFVMRRMSFPIDMIFVGGDKRITAINHAEKPIIPGTGEMGRHRYTHTAKYVIEANYEWTTEREITEGDRVGFEL